MIDRMRPNALGDVRAEADRDMLSRAFVETPDYRALIESPDRTIVVGRRGTGKSALVAGLRKHWDGKEKVSLLSIAPEEYQALSLRPLASLFGPRFEHIRAGIRIAWRHAFMMETIRAIAQHYSFKRRQGSDFLLDELRLWDGYGRHVLDKHRELLRSMIDKRLSPEARIGDLAEKLKLQDVEDALSALSADIDRELVILIDCLDEGYQPDGPGVGIVDGLIQGAIDVKTRFSGVMRSSFFVITFLDPSN